MGGRQRWTELDRAKAIAFEELAGEECPNCHTLAEDWKDEYGRMLEEPVYTPVARSCPGCAEVERIREKLPKDAKGAYVTLIPLEWLDDEDDDWIDIVKARAEAAKQRELLGE